MATEVTVYSTAGEVRFSTPVNGGSKRVYQLMGDDYVTLVFSVSEPVALAMGDYADIEGFGRFVVTSKQTPEYNAETGGYDYILKLEAQYRMWANRLFKFIPEAGAPECSWVLTADVRTHLEQVMKNLQVFGKASSAFLYNGKDEWVFSIDADVEGKAAKTVSYDGISILDAIAAIAEAFECEWWVDNNVIRIGHCELDGDPIDLEIGVNVESMTRSDTGELHATRIFPYGGTRNIPSNYRKELVFTVTDADAERNCIKDAARPLSHEWFPAGMVTSKFARTDEWNIGSHSTGIVGNNFSNTGDFPLSFGGSLQMYWPCSKDIDDLDIGEYRLDLSGYKPSFYKSSGGTAAVSSMFVRVSVSGTYTLNGEIKVEEHHVDVGQYMYSADRWIEAGRSGIDIQIAHPLTGCRLSITAYATVGQAGQIKLGCVPYGKIVLRSAKIIYGIKGIEFAVLDKDKAETDTITGVVYNQGLSAEKEDSEWLSLPEGKSLPAGTSYLIRNIVKENVPLSYYSSIYGEGDSGIITNSAVERRLMLPEGDLPYIDAYEDMPETEVIEAQVIYDDIFPQREEEISGVDEVTKEETTELEDGSRETVTKTYYDIRIANFTAETPFIKDYIVESVGGDEKLTINFISGVLNGRSFELKFNPEGNDIKNADGTYNGEAQVFRVVPDESSVPIPNKILKPAAGDKFVLTNFRVQLIAEHYVADAQIKLRDTAVKDIEKAKEDASVYSCCMMSDYMAGYDGDSIIEDEAMLPVLTVGRKVNLVNPAYFADKRESRIVGIEYNLDIPYDTPILSVGNKTEYKRISAAEDRIGKLEAAMGGSWAVSGAGGNGVVAGGSPATSGNGTYLIRRDDATPASDTNSYSALRAIVEFARNKAVEKIEALWHFLKGLTVGDYVKGESGAAVDGQGNAEVGSLEARSYAKIGGDAEVAGAVRAGRDIESGGTVKATEGMQSPGFRTPDFNANALMGTGAGVYTLNGMTYGEVDYLTVRRGMTVAELLIQQYRAIGGAFVVSRANGKISEIDDTVVLDDGGEYYALYLEDTDNSPRFIGGDLIRCAHFDTSMNVYRSYWVEVSSVDYANEGCIYVAKSQFTGGVTPLAGDNIVQMGHVSDTTRQGCILITVEQGRPQIVMYDGISQPRIVPGNCRAIYGNLEGVLDPVNGEPLKGYGLWSSNVYLHGSFSLKSGKTVESALIDALSNRRNYARGTGNVFRITSAKGGTNETYPMYDVYGLRTGDEVTVSFDWKYIGIINGADGTSRIAMQFGPAYGYVSTGLRITDAADKGSDSGHVCHTLTIPKVYNSDSDATTADNGAVMMRLDSTLFSDGGYIEVSNFIITAGDKEAEWVEAPEDAFADAAKAQADADAAKARLDRWADDGVISPTEKPGLKDEIRRIGSDYSEIGSRYENYQSHIEDDTELAKLYGAWDSYDLAYMAYSNMLIELSADSPETIAIPVDFRTTQSAYYLARAEILQLFTVTYNAHVSHSFKVTEGLFESVQGQVNTLANAGRNLLLQTNEGVKGWRAISDATGGFAVSAESGYNGVQFTRNGNGVSSYEVFVFQLRPELIQKGKLYTLSFDAKVGDDGVDGQHLLVNICENNGTNALIGSSQRASNPLAYGTWVHHTFVLTATTSGVKGGAQNIYIAMRSSDANTISGIAFANLKLEEGNIPTPWSKAPEDLGLGMDVLREDYKSKITQTAEEIRFDVSRQVEALGGRITENSSAIKQTAEEIKLTVSEQTAAKRNYAYGTGIDKSVTGFDASGTNNTIRLYDITGLATGDEITVSFDINLPQMIVSSDARLAVQLSGEFGWASVGVIFAGGVDAIYPGGTHHVSTTITLGKNNNGEDIAASDTGYIYLRLDNLGTVSSIRVSRLKVEKGGYETPWTPITTDVVESLKETGIDIALDRIRMKAPKTEVVAYDEEGNEYPVAMFTTKEVTEGGATKTVPVINAALVEVDGLTAKRLIAVDSSGQVVSTINVMAEDGKYYTHYPVTYDSEGNADETTVKTTADGYNIGYPASCFGYDPDTDYIIRAFTPSGKSQWGFKIGDEQGNQAGFFTAFDKWKALGLCQISENTDTGEDAGGYTVPLVFPVDVTLSKDDNGTYSASPAYPDTGTGIALPVKYKEFMPGSQSAYLDGANHIKPMTAGELADFSNLGEDYDFTVGITGKFVKTMYPVQGKVTVISNELTRQASVRYTWAIYVYEDGSLIDTIYKVMTITKNL